MEETTSILTLQRRFLKKISSSEVLVNCLNRITLYSSKMGGIDLMDQLNLVYHFDLSFDLFNVALVNSFMVYKKLGSKDLTLKQFKICRVLKLIASFISQKLFCPNHRPFKRTKIQRPGPILPSHLPILLETRRRCTVCSQAGKENRTFVTCSLFDVALCLQKEGNCFLRYHL